MGLCLKVIRDEGLEAYRQSMIEGHSGGECFEQLKGVDTKVAAAGRDVSSNDWERWKSLVLHRDGKIQVVSWFTS